MERVLGRRQAELSLEERSFGWFVAVRRSQRVGEGRSGVNVLRGLVNEGAEKGHVELQAGRAASFLPRAHADGSCAMAEVSNGSSIIRQLGSPPSKTGMCRETRNRQLLAGGRPASASDGRRMSFTSEA